MSVVPPGPPGLPVGIKEPQKAVVKPVASSDVAHTGSKANLKRRLFVFRKCTEMELAKVSLAQQAKTLGVAYKTLANIKCKPWWRELEDQYMVRAQGRFQTKIAAAADTFADGMIDVASGKNDETSKTASARVNAAKLFAEIGRGGGGLLPKTPSVAITNDNRSVTNVGATVTNIQNLGADALRDFLRTGTLPPQLVNPE
jgi:hypothetical protein